MVNVGAVHSRRVDWLCVAWGVGRWSISGGMYSYRGRAIYPMCKKKHSKQLGLTGLLGEDILLTYLDDSVGFMKLLGLRKDWEGVVS